MVIVSAATAMLSAAIYWYAFRFETINFKLSEVEINIKKQQEAQFHAVPLFTILHLSDLHLRKDRKGYRLFEFIQSLTKLNPDMLVITGDLVERDEYFPYLIDMLRGLNAKMGKFAVFGVHDYFHKEPKEFLRNMVQRQKSYKRKNDTCRLIENLESIGIEVLENKKVSININKSTHQADNAKNKESVNHRRFNNMENATETGAQLSEIEVAGVGDAIIQKADVGAALGEENAGGSSGLPGRNRKKYKEIFKILPDRSHALNATGKLLICLTHTPDMDFIVDMAEKNADIIICGHTHGGQVRLPGLGAILTGSNIKAKYASGLFYFKDFVLYISRGLGEGRYSPFRFYCQPEATLIKINQV